MARVPPGAPRLAVDRFCRQQLEGYGSRRLLDGLAPRHGQQRRGYSGRTFERSCNMVVGRVTFEVQGDENSVCGGLDCFRGFAGGLGCVTGLRKSRCGCSGAPTFRNVGLSPLKQPTTRPRFAGPASVTRNNLRLGAHTPQIEFNFR